VLKAALRQVHGATVIDTQLSGYYVADEVSGTYRGMMIAIPPPEWQVFRQLTVPELAEVLIDLAGKGHLAQFRKHPRDPRSRARRARLIRSTRIRPPPNCWPRAAPRAVTVPPEAEPA